MSCGGITILNQGCTNVIRLTTEPAVQLVVKLTAIGPTGPQGKPGRNWDWETVSVANPIDIVYSSFFRNELAPIIFIDGAPFPWARLGVTQNKKDQPGEESQTPFLDFSGYALGNGQISGDIDFQYVQPQQ